MISLGSPIIAAGDFGMYQHGVPPDFETLARPESVLAGAIVGYNVLSSTLAQINELCNCFFSTADTPTELARRRANQLLSEAQTIAPISLGASSVEDFEGDILIHWDAPQRSVVLICPAAEHRQPEIYREQLSGSQAIETSLTPNASANDLSEALAWVLNS